MKLDDGSEISGKTDGGGKATLDLDQSGMIVFSDLTMAGEAARADYRPHVVRQGEYVDRLAFMYGFDAAKVWDDGANAELKAKRGNPNLLYPGDLLQIPTAPRKGAPLSKGTTNAYSVRVPRTKLSILFQEGDHALANEPYVVQGLGVPLEGKTGSDGAVDLEVPVHTRELIVTFTNRGVSYPVRIGNMDPIDEPMGVRKRLEQLGYYDVFDGDAGSETEENERLAAALSAYQEAKGLPRTGEADGATRVALIADHKC